MLALQLPNMYTLVNMGMVQGCTTAEERNDFLTGLSLILNQQDNTVHITSKFAFSLNILRRNFMSKIKKSETRPDGTCP